jgi:hypothetical protein
LGLPSISTVCSPCYRTIGSQQSQMGSSSNHYTRIATVTPSRNGMIVVYQPGDL